MDCARASSAEETLALLNYANTYSVPPALMIITSILPDATGAELVEAIRRDDRFADIRAIIAAPPGSSSSNGAGVANPYFHSKSDGIIESVNVLVEFNAAQGDFETQTVENDQRSIPDATSESLDILIAEDNDINQLVLSQFLQETPYTFSIVCNGRRAVHAYRNAHPRLILMDISMPEMNGKEATAAIRAIEIAAGSHVPIIALTAHALVGDREDCMASGMDDYMSKPVNFAALRELLDYYLTEQGGRRAA